MQAATVMLPRRHAQPGAGGLLWAVVPALALGLGVVVLRLAAGGPHALTLLAAIATPALAGAGRVKGPVAAVFWLVAWLADGLAAQLAAVALVALAATTLAEVAARFAPRHVLAVSLVALAALDVVLVWVTPQVGPASNALHAASLPHGIPHLQDATFGDATMGWLDFVAPAVLGVAVLRRARAAAATCLAGCAWGLLLLVASTVPATVPAVAGLLAAAL